MKNFLIPESHIIHDKWWHRLAQVIIWGWLLYWSIWFVAVEDNIFKTIWDEIVMWGLYHFLQGTFLFVCFLMIPSIVYRLLLYIGYGTTLKD